MAIVQNPITGRASGLYGNVIFQTMWGLNIMRSVPTYITPNQSPERLKWQKRVQIGSSIISNCKKEILSYAPNSLKNSPFTSYFNSQILKNLTCNIDTGYCVLDKYMFLGGGKPFFARGGFNAVGITAEHIYLTMNNLSNSQYHIDNSNKFYLITFDHTMSILYYGDVITYEEMYNQFVLDTNLIDIGNTYMMIITIQNTPNLNGIMPSSVLYPVNTTQCNSFYLTAFIQS